MKAINNEKLIIELTKEEVVVLFPPASARLCRVLTQEWAKLESLNKILYLQYYHDPQNEGRGFLFFPWVN
ncbi:MAG: hypothetical protein Aureis2KO_23850 [Aureisphaera sp.]